MPEVRLRVERAENVKPPYRVPSMAEIAALPWNGYRVASTFSGCGGSSLGYKMAGFKVVWASEFIEEAQRTYRANHPGTILDTRDIRQVTPESFFEATGLKAGELDLLDGSPPCSAFSTVGKREAGWGTVKKYSDKAQRVDDLFFEFARMVRGIQPKVFVAENVAGLVKGTAKGYFKLILAELKACGYQVEARVLNAQWLGVPQSRQRLIFVGVRNDIARCGVAPAHPCPLPYQYTVRDACPWLTSCVNDTGGSFGEGEVIDRRSPAITASSHYQFTVAGGVPLDHDPIAADISKYAIGLEWDKLQPGETHPDRPCPTITQKAGSGGAAGVTHPFERRKFSIAEVRRLCGFPDDFILTGTFSQQWERLGRAVPPVMMGHIAATVRDKILSRCAA